MSNHTPPADFPTHHYTAVAVPKDLALVIVAAAAKNGVLFEDQLLTWTQMGAECQRQHASESLNPRRKK